MSDHDFRKLLEHITDQRQLRLFVVACCRNIWHSLTDQRSKDAVEVAESFADGLVSEEELNSARDAARVAARDVAWAAENAAARAAAWYAAWVAAWAAAWAAANSAAWAAMGVAECSVRDAAMDATNAAVRDATNAAVRDVIWATEREQQLVLLKDITNQPSITLNPNLLLWNNSLLPKFATNIYTNKDFTLMPILADALEDANAPIAYIQHAREEVHVKGCWLLDVLMGKR